MPSEAVLAMADEIDAAVESMTTEQAAGTELINEEVGETENNSEEVGATPEKKESEDVTEETEKAKETVDEESVSGDDDRKETERPEATPAEINSDTLERAVAAGIPVADAIALTPAGLERVISAREQAYVEQDAREQASKFRETKEEKVDEVDPFDQLPPLDPDKYEPEMIAHVEGLKNIARAQQKKIKDYEERTELAQETQNQFNQQEIEVWYNGQIEALGDDFADTLGKGKWEDLSQGSSQFNKRIEIAEQMGVMKAGYQAQGIHAPPREDLFDAAARLVLKDRFAELTEKRIAKDLKKQSKQHIQRSAGTKATGKLSPQEEAAAAIDARWG